ncbi:hypothetical protein M8J76_009922 [Diaphorina citri]|nr:hypothetical protein M8J76_009922 [Diaphorina citri]
MAVCPRNGTLIIQGEINKLLIAMKRGTTWSSYSQQDEKIEALLKKFNNLKVELNSIGDLKSIDSILFLEPFLEVITSDQTSSSVTSLALVSINTFLSYALIDPGGHNVAASVCKIAEAVTRAKFSSSDLDSVVLMRILLVLRNLVVSPIGVYLTNENVCEIMSSIFRVCFETRLAELLRKYAEHCLKDIVQCLFTQLPQFSEDLDDPSNVKSISTRSESSHNKQQRQKKISQESVTSDVDTVVHNNASPDDKVQTELPPNDNIHLATSPCSPSGPMLDLQGDILSQDTLQSPSGDMLQSPNGETPGDILNGDIQRSCENFPEEIKHTQSAEVIQDPVTQEVQTQDIQSETVDPRDSTSLDISADKQDGVEITQSNSEVSNDTRPNHLDLSQCDNTSKDPTGSEPVKPESLGEADVQTHPDETNAQQNGEPVNQEGQSNDVQQIRESDQPEEYVNQQGVRFTSSDPVEEGVSKGPYGIVSVREILRCLVQLCDSHNKNNSESMIHIGLTLLSVAFEVGADSIAQFPSLMAIVKDDMCKYLIALLFTADRLTIFAANLQLLFLVFESMRHHLKFQFEMYLTRLLDIISSDNQRFRYEMKEIALESIVQLWRIPGLVTELYLNYDCNLYCPNLYEEQTKMLSKNCFPVHGIYNFHLLSLDALLTVIDSIENFCKQKTLNENSDSLGIRTKPKGTAIPSHEELMAIKRKKKLLTIGTEQFNMNSKKGIKFLQEQGLLSTPLDPIEVVHFLRENPHLDKKTIGEYLSNRSNLAVLDQFVKSFDFSNTRIDVALRMYLESFRLPGESPLISLLMEQFADHWHNNPMTLQAFKKNLAGVNGGDDFNSALLDDIYKTIK